jgi:uncharacterized protein (DUF362 family)
MDPKDLSRRDFLKLIGAATAGAAFLGAAGVEPDEAEAAYPYYLTIAKGGNSDAALCTRKAIAGLGGMGRFVRSGQSVIIKPNMCTQYRSPAYAATTNPTVVATLVRLCKAAGASSVRVMDTPIGGASASVQRAAWSKSGIGPAVQAAGGTMAVMSSLRFRSYAIPAHANRAMTSCYVYRDIMECDVLINVPIAKVHGLTRLTLGGKNLLGVAKNPSGLHSGIDRKIADLVSLVRPNLTVVDGIRILVSNGPTGGSLSYVRRKNTVVASRDPVAADSRATWLFGLHGSDIGYIRAMAAIGLGKMNLSGLNKHTYNV